MVVVAACGEERRLRAERRHLVESHDVAIEPEGLRDVRDLEMDVAHDRPARQAVERLPLGIVELSQQVLEIERLGGHPRDLPLPELARTVCVDLDPVPVRVAQIQGLADEVVGDTGHRHLLTNRVREPGGEIPTFRDEQCEVEETRVARRRLRARNLVEDEQLRISAE